MPRAKKKRGHALRPKEQAALQAQRELGLSTYAIAKKTGHAECTVRKYLAHAEAYAEPEMRALVEQIKEGEIADLVVLQTQARERLHELAPRMNPIEAIALMDRSFQQRRLLEGNSTANISTITKIVQEANDYGSPPKAAAVIEGEIIESPAAPSSPARNVVDIEEEAHGNR
jgi:hypothetical protein